MRLSWASSCVRCRSSPSNTGRCRNHLCWHTAHAGCTGETQLNIRPYLHRGGEGDLKCLYTTNACEIFSHFLSAQNASSLSHIRSVWGEERAARAVCFKPARKIILQCSSHGGKQKQLVGEPTAEWVSYECSSNKHGLWILCCQKHIFTWSLLLPINTDEENMWSCAVIHLVIHGIGHGTDLNVV